MKDAVEIKDIFLSYMGQGTSETAGIGMLGLFLVALIGLVWYSGRKKQTAIVWAIIFSVLCVFNNLSMKILAKFTSDQTFYRFFWAVPILFVIAFVVVKALEESKGILAKGAIVVLVMAIFMNMGPGFATRERFVYSGSMEKIPGDVKQIGEIIEANKMSERPVCLMDLSTQLMIRVENPKVVWAVGRNKRRYFEENGYGTGKYKYVENMLRVVDSGEKIRPRKFKRALKRKNVEFVVVSKGFEMEEYMQRVGLNLVGESDSYLVYQNKEIQVTV